MMEYYWLLFTDIFFANLIFTVNNELVNWVMIEFGGYNRYYIFFVSIAAVLMASFANYFFGLVLYNIYKTKTNSELTSRYNIWQKFIQKYGVYLTIFTLITAIGNFYTVIVGFCKMQLHKLIATIFVLRICYYTYYILLI